MEPTRPGKRKHDEDQLDREDRDRAERKACALESIARDIHGLRHIAHFIAEILQESTGMSDEQKARLAAKAASITARVDASTAAVNESTGDVESVT